MADRLRESDAAIQHIPNGPSSNLGFWGGFRPGTEELPHTVTILNLPRWFSASHDILWTYSGFLRLASAGWELLGKTRATKLRTRHCKSGKLERSEMGKNGNGKGNKAVLCSKTVKN
jgi:hypothetical protein